MPAAQQMIAERSYDPEKHGGIAWSEFQKGDKYEDYLSGFAPKKVEMGLFESMFAEEPLYDIAGEQFKKSEISLMGRLSSAERLAELIGTDTSNVLSVQNTINNEVIEQEEEIEEVIDNPLTNLNQNVLKIAPETKQVLKSISNNNQIDFSKPYTIQVKR